MGLLLPLYLPLYYLYNADKQSDKKTIYSFNDTQAPGLHIIQYYNIYKTVIIMMLII